MSKVKMIAFDMDGVLVDTEKSISDFWSAQATKYGFSISRQTESQYITGCSSKSTIAALFPKGKNVEEDILTSLQKYETSLSYIPVHGVINTINQLHQYHIRISLVTGAEPWKVDAVLSCLDLSANFEHIVTAKQITHSKPDPEPYLLCAQLADLEPRNCIVFEDSENGVRAATSAGMTCIGVHGKHASAPLIKAGAGALIRDFSEVSISADKMQLHDKSYCF